MKQIRWLLLFLILTPAWLFAEETDKPFIGFFVRKENGYNFQDPDWKLFKLKDYQGSMQPSGRIEINEDGSFSTSFGDPSIPTLFIELFEEDAVALEGFTETVKGKMLAVKVGKNLIWEGMLWEPIVGGKFKFQLDSEETLKKWEDSLKRLIKG